MYSTLLLCCSSNMKGHHSLLLRLLLEKYCTTKDSLTNGILFCSPYIYEKYYFCLRTQFLCIDSKDGQMFNIIILNKQMSGDSITTNYWNNDEEISFICVKINKCTCCNVGALFSSVLCYKGYLRH